MYCESAIPSPTYEALKSQSATSSLHADFINFGGKYAFHICCTLALEGGTDHRLIQGPGLCLNMVSPP